MIDIESVAARSWKAVELFGVWRLWLSQIYLPSRVCVEHTEPDHPSGMPLSVFD
jgi:hypothetical protein